MRVSITFRCFRWRKIFIAIVLMVSAFSLSGQKSQKSPAVEKDIIPPINFESFHRWISVPEGTTDDKLTEMVKKEVEYQLGINPQPLKYESAMVVYQKWMQEKQGLNDRWKQRMLELGMEVRNQVSEVSRLRQESIALKNKLEVKKTELNALEQTLKNDSLSLKRFIDEKAFLTNNLYNQLDDISYMVVALGKRKYDITEDLNKVIDLIGNKMMVEAIKEVNGTQIRALQVVQNNKLISDSIVSVEAGHAQVLDTYTNDFARLQENVDIRYLVQAIEVRPFREEKEAKKTAQIPGEEVKTHLVDRSNLDNIWLAENLASDPTKNTVKDFLVWLVEQAENHNREIAGKISSIYDSYQKRLSEVEAKIASLMGSINDKRIKIIPVRNEYNAMKTQVDNYESSALNPAIENLKLKEREYSDNLNTRVFLTDKTEEGRVQATAVDAYADFAGQTLNKIKKEIKEAEYANSVVSVNYQLASYSESLVIYTPRIRAFTILYLSRKELSTYVNYTVSVGYQMELKPKEKITTPEITETKPAKIEPSKVTEVGYYDTPGLAWVVTVSGNYAFVADWDAGLRVINISNPARPTEAGYYDTPGKAYGVAVSGNYAYVADGDAGLRVIKIGE